MSMAAMAATGHGQSPGQGQGQGQANDGIELPQLLQNLLVSVERSIERVSLNELQMPLALGEDQLDEANNNSNNNNSNNIGSPKCALRRSDLITKNKLFNNRYMLRRLTNRQDSMNSTSSGNSNASERSSSSGSSSAGEELHGHLNINNNNKNNNNKNNNINNSNNNTELVASTSPALPLFCLGNSFPHIDSDEEASDAAIGGEKRQTLASSESQPEPSSPMETETELLPPNSISELPEKLLNSGVYLPGTRTLQGDPLVHVDADAVAGAGLNCYELATLLLYYSTIPERSIAHKSAQQQQQQLQLQSEQQQQQLKPAQQTFTILIAIEKSQHLCVIDLICQSLKLLSKQIGNCEILAVCLDANLLQLCNQQQQQQQQQQNSSNSCDQTEQSQSQLQLQSQSSQPSHLVKFISVDQVTTSVAPSHLPSGALRGQHHHDARKWREFFAQLEAFQRQCSAAGGRLVGALSDIRAADLLGLPTRRQLYGQHRALSRALMDSQLHNLRKHGATQLVRLQAAASAINAPPAAAAPVPAAAPDPTAYHLDAAHKLRKVTLLYSEVDRAAQRLEQLTEQRRERLRQLTRQRALEDEINEVTSWLANDGAENLQKFAQLQLDNEAQLKAQELEFEKYYFIARKHLAKGRDLHLAAQKIAVLSESARNLKTALDQFAEKLEKTRERIEGGARLRHLLTQHQRETAALEELQRLAAELGATALIDKHLPAMRRASSQPGASSTPAQAATKRGSYRCSSGNGSSFEGATGGSHCSCWRESRNLEDMDEPEEEHDQECDGDADGDGEEQQSKIADSGVGVCDNCERNPKLARICSCQSLNEKSHDELLEDECFDRPTKRYMDMHSPMEANAHLQCHASNLELTKLEELSCLEPKIQKTLLLIMREMIGTERDYVRSLYYVIENYIDELLREDIPQPLRGQRNVIFGNIEKIFEFHNSHFLGELERYERNPLKVGAAFLEMESKFYLYALYNKNKPKSDTLLSEYGSSFFKPKQLQLQDKMDLASYLLKPVQRMGKYALLLQQLVKAVKSVEGAALQEIAADVEELQRAEEMVKFQLRHGNDLLAMDSLRDCDVNVKEQGRLLRQNEFLVWQGRGGKKTLRQVFLFEELVLFSKARRFPDHKNLDIYIYKNSIKTSDIGLTAHTGDSTTKFEIWFRKRKPDDTWMLQCMSEDIKNAWTEEISKLLWKQAKRNREIRLAEMSSMGIGSKPCLDIRPSNNQISDRSIPLTQLNKTPKLRHAEPGKGSMRRPNSLISESSLSSGTSTTSSSSISGGGCSSGMHAAHETGRHSLNLSFSKLSGSHLGSSGSSGNNNNNNNPTATLELINETQALKLSNSSEPDNAGCSQRYATPTLVSSGSSRSNKRNHKRSTTIVSQLSMESGILSDMSITPDHQEHAHVHAAEQLSGSRGSWSTSTSGMATATASTSTVILRRYKSYAHAAEAAAPESNK
ncbi:rho guanine nucleotide exchange factor 40 isoform X2 [Drosophila montana]